MLFLFFFVYLGLGRRVVNRAPDLAIVRLEVLQIQCTFTLVALEAELVPRLVGSSHQLHGVDNLSAGSASEQKKKKKKIKQEKREREMVQRQQS